MKRILLILIPAILIVFLLVFKLFVTKNIAEKNKTEGISLYDSSKYELASEKFMQSLHWQKSDTEAQLYLAKSFFYLNELVKSDSLCDVLIPIYNNADIYNLKGKVAAGMNQHTEAISFYNTAIEKDPEFFYAYHNRGISYASMGEYKKAITDYELAKELNSSADVLLKSVEARTQLMDYKGAIEDYNKILENDANNTEILYGRGRLKFVINDLEGAITDFTQVISLAPQNGEAYYYRGVSYAKQKDFNSAKTDLLKAKENKSNIEKSSYNLAKIYFEEQNKKQAQKELKNIDFETIDNQLKVDILQLQVSFAFSESNFTQANNMLNQALEINPEKYELYYYRAITHEKLKTFAQGIDDLTVCIKNKAMLKESHYVRGILYINIRNTPAACSDFKISANMGHEHARVLLNKHCS